MLRIVSTYNPANWSAFVQRNIRSWLEFLEADAELVIYHEGPEPALQRDRIVWRQWEDIPGAQDFVNECLAFPAAQGLFGRAYDYNYDAAKFSRKVYAQLDAADEGGDLLVWLDSDVEIIRPLETERIREILSGMALATYQRPGYHSETGIVMWDQAQAGEFWHAYRALYDNRRVFCLPNGWHDCWALDYVADKLRIPVANLTRGGRDYTSPHHQSLHVVPDSELGHYLRHDKGQRKYAA